MEVLTGFSVPSPVDSASSDSNPPTPSLFKDFEDLFAVDHVAVSPIDNISFDPKMEISIAPPVENAIISPPTNTVSASIDDGWTEVSNKRRRPSPMSDLAQSSETLYHALPSVPVIFTSLVDSAPMNKINPTIASDILQIRAGKVLSARLINSNELLVKVATPAQADRLLGLTEIAGTAVQARLAETYAHPNGIIMGVDPYVSEVALLDSLRGAGAKEVRRKTFTGSAGRTINTSRVVVTFHAHPMPTEVRIGFDTFKVKPYVAPPEICRYCFRWGHRASVCRSKIRCGFCAGPHSSKSCPTPKRLKCGNCGQGHHAATMNCPARLRTIDQRRSVVLEGLTWSEAIAKSKGTHPVPKTKKVIPSFAAESERRQRSFADVTANRAAQKAPVKASASSKVEIAVTVPSSNPSSLLPNKVNATTKSKSSKRKSKTKKSAVKQKFGSHSYTDRENVSLTTGANENAAPSSASKGDAPPFSLAKPSFSTFSGMDCHFGQTSVQNGNTADPTTSVEDKFISKAIFDKRNDLISSTMQLLVKLISGLMTNPEKTGPVEDLLALAGARGL